MESPRKRKLSCPTRPRKRWRKNRPSFTASTISPGQASSSVQAAISTLSPGQRVGSMLSPCTCRYRRPLIHRLATASDTRAFSQVNGESSIAPGKVRMSFATSCTWQRCQPLCHRPGRPSQTRAPSGKRASDTASSCLSPWLGRKRSVSREGFGLPSAVSRAATSGSPPFLVKCKRSLLQRLYRANIIRGSLKSMNQHC